MAVGNLGTGSALAERLYRRRPPLTVVRQRAPTTTRTQAVPLDYQALLADDPTLQATLRQLNAQGLQQQGSLAEGQQQTLARLGEVPAGANLGNLAGALTPELRGLVEQSNQAGLSTLAQLAHNYGLQRSASLGSVAGRGLARSGAVGQHEAENLHDYTLQQYNARQQALDALSGLQNTYLSGQSQLANQAAGAVGDAQHSILDQINAGLIAPGQRQVTQYQPFQNPSAPAQSYAPVATGSQTAPEPHPTGQGYQGVRAPKAAPYKPQLGWTGQTARNAY